MSDNTEFQLDTTRDIKMVRDFENSLNQLVATMGKIDQLSLNKVTAQLSSLNKSGSENLQALARGSIDSIGMIQKAINSLNGGSKAFDAMAESQKRALSEMLAHTRTYILTQEILLDASLSAQDVKLAKANANQLHDLERFGKERAARAERDAREQAALEKLKQAELAANTDAYLKRVAKLEEGHAADKLRDLEVNGKAQAALEKLKQAELAANTDAYLKRVAKLEDGYQADLLRDMEFNGKARVAHEKLVQQELLAAKLLGIRDQVAAASNAPSGTFQRYNAGTKTAGGLVQAAEVKALSLEFDGLERNATSAFSGIARGFGLVSSSLFNILPMMAGFAISAGTLKSLKVGTEFETSMFVIKELAGNATAEVNDLGKALLDLGRTSQYGPLEAAKGVEILTLAGLTLKDAMVALKPTLDFAAAGGVSLDAAAATLVAVSTAYGYSAQAFSTVGDIIAKTAAESMASVQGMSESFKAASVVAQLYGVSLSDTAFMLAALSQIGIQGSAAGTSVRNFYTEITKQSGKAFEALKKFNIAVYDSADAGGQLKGTLEIFKQIALATENLSTKGLQKFYADISNERGGKTASSVSATAEQKIQAELLLQIKRDLNLADEKAVLTTAQIAEGYDRLIAKQKDYAKNASGFAFIASMESQLTTLGSYKGLLASLQTDFVEAFNGSSDAVFVLSGRLREVFNSKEFQSGLDSMVRGVVSLISGLASAIAFVTEYSGAVAVAVGAMILAVPVLEALTVGMRTLAIGAVAAEAALAPVVLPLGLLVGAAALLTYGVIELAKSWESAGDAADNASRRQIKAAKETGDALQVKIDFTTKTMQKELEEITASNLLREGGLSKQLAADRVFAEAALARIEQQHQINISNLTGNSILAERNELEQQYANRDWGAKDKSSEISARVSAKLSSDIAEENRRYSEQLFVQNDLNTALKLAKERRSELDEKESKKLMRTGTDDNAKEKKAKKERTYSDVTLPQDNSLSQLMQRHKLEYDEINKHEANVESLLKAKEQAHLITEGAYQAELFKSTRQAEEAKLDLIARTADKANVLYMFRKEDIESTIDKATAEGPSGARKVQQYTAALERLNEAKKTEEATLASESRAVVDKRYTTMELAAIKAQGAVYDLSEAERKYWKADAEALKKAKALDAINDKYRNINTSVFSLDEAAKAGDIAGADATEKHAAHIAELSDAYGKASTSAADFKRINSELLAAGDTEAVSYYNGLLLNKEALDRAIADGKGRAAASATEAANLAFSKVRKDQVDKLSSDISNALVDGLISGSKVGAASLRSILMAELRKPLTQQVKLVIDRASASVQEWLTGGSSGGASGSSAGLTGVAGSVLNWLSGSSNTGKDVAGMLGYNSGGMPSATAATEAGSAYSSAISNGATEAAATKAAESASTAASSMYQLGQGLGYLNAAVAASKGQWGSAAGGAIGAWFGGAVGAAIGSQIGGMIDSAFGSGADIPKTEGGFSNLGKTTYSYGGSATDLKAKGIVDGLSTAYANIADLTGAKGVLTGSSWLSIDPKGTSMTQLDVQAAVNGKEVYNRGKTMGGIENVGKSDAELQAAVALSTSAALIEALKATDLSPALNAYLLPVTTAGKTIEELTTVLNNVTATAELTKFLKALPFRYLKDMSVEASVALLKAAGGLAALSTDLSSYYDNFYSTPEKTAIKLDYVTKALKDLGITMGPISETTKAWYRSEVERLGAMDLSVEANAKAYASALKLSGVINDLSADFDATAAAAAATEKNRQSWQDKLSVLVGIKTSAQVQLEQDLASTTDEATKAIIRQIFRQQSLKDAVAAAITAADAAYSALDRAVSAQKTALTVQKTTLSAQVTASTTLVSTLTSIFTMLGTSIASLYGTVSTTSVMLVDQAKATLTQALASGILPEESVLSAAISTLTNNLTDNNYTSAFAKNADALTLASTLTGIQTLAGGQISVAQQQLTASQSAVDLIDAQLTTLDATLANAKLQLDALKGIDTSVLSVVEALKEFNKSTATLGTANTNLASGSASFISGPGGAVAGPTGKKGDGSGNFYTEYADPSGQYQVKVSGSDAISKYTGIQTAISDIGANPAALAAYAKENNLTINDLATASGYLYSDVYALFTNAGISRFATGGDHAGGWRLVGENGPELENTGPSRIYNAAMTASMLGAGGDDNGDQIAALRQDIRAQAGATVRLQADFVKILNRWDANGMPETRVTT